MKKRLNLLCAFVLLTIAFSTFMSVGVLIEGIKQGYQSAMSGKPVTGYNYQMLCTMPTDLNQTTATLFNAKDSTQLAMKPIVAIVNLPEGTEEEYAWATPLISFLSLGVSLYALVQFIRLVRNVNRNDIFSWRNVSFLRRVGGALLAMFACECITLWISNHAAAQVLELVGCRISYAMALNTSLLLLGFVSLLMAEIFAIGLKMKEEQELTI